MPTHREPALRIVGLRKAFGDDVAVDAHARELVEIFLRAVR
ncbi:hypothetical protein [Nonomuraea recticatena]